MHIVSLGRSRFYALSVESKDINKLGGFYNLKQMVFMQLLINGDCLEEMKRIEDGSVDLVLTSPPYDNLRTYNGSLNWSFEIFKPIAKEISRLIKPGGVIVWIVNDATINGSETGSSFRQALYFKDECGLSLHDTMIWKKSCSPYQHSNRYIPVFEYMFVFSNGKIKTSNIIKDRLNKWAGTKEHGTDRQKDGTTKPKSAVKLKNNRVIKKHGSRFNIWEITELKTNKDHPAAFPEMLASDHIISWSNPGNTILDPFMGSGSTGVACKNLNRSFIGIEKDESYYKIAVDRIENA